MKTFSVRLSENENAILERISKRRKMSKNRIIRELVKKRGLDKRILKIEKLFEINADIILSLSRVTGNINQIAHHLNSGNFIADPKEFFEVADELKIISKEFLKISQQNQTILKSVL